MVAITTAVSRCSISARWTVAGVHQRPEPSDVAWVLLIPPCGELRTLALIADTIMQRLFVLDVLALRTIFAHGRVGEEPTGVSAKNGNDSNLMKLWRCPTD